jgi:hypothetical protein
MSEPTENIIVSINSTEGINAKTISPETASTIETTECEVCYEKYNKTIHAKIICEFSDCKYEACKTCVRTYLLGTISMPNCMKCNKVWSEAFIVLNLNQSFVKTEYKKHRKELLLEHQISRLPESMGLVENYKLLKTEENEYKKIKNQLLELRKFENDLKNKSFAQYDKIQRLINDKTKKETKRQFIMACANNDCRGYLSTQYKCDICELFTCSKCFDTKNDTHICKEENVQSAELIRKETKPCPKCGSRISKIDGCDQMWCTECHVAFSWITGNIQNGTIHNPEFYRYMQTTHGLGGAPRNPGDVICGGMPGHYEMRKILSKFLDKKNDIQLRKSVEEKRIEEDKIMEFKNKIELIHRNLIHISQYEVDRYRATVQNLDNFEQERVKYLVNEITKKEFATKIYNNDVKRKKETEILHIFELVTSITIDLFRSISLSKNVEEIFVNEVKGFLTEMNNLSVYCNAQLQKISSTYGLIVPQFTSTFTISNKKFSIKGTEIVKKEKKPETV